MIERIIWISITFSFLAWGACQSKPNTSISPKEEAAYKGYLEAVCNCAKPVISLNEELNNLKQQGERERLMAKMQKAQNLVVLGINCAKEARADFPNLVLSQGEIKVLLPGICKNIPPMLVDEIALQLMDEE